MKVFNLIFFNVTVHFAELWLYAVISALLTSFLLILSLVTVSFTLVICRMKFREKIGDLRNGRNPNPVGKKKDDVNKTDIPVVSNQAYVLHNNISRCVQVLNEIHTVSQKPGNEESVYELVK